MPMRERFHYNSTDRLSTSMQYTPWCSTPAAVTGETAPTQMVSLKSGFKCLGQHQRHTRSHENIVPTPPTNVYESATPTHLLKQLFSAKCSPLEAPTRIPAQTATSIPDSLTQLLLTTKIRHQSRPRSQPTQHLGTVHSVTWTAP
jgi:hypothetical protein